MSAYKVGAYVKLAKLWDRKRSAAIAYHNNYYKEKLKDNSEMGLVDVYVDITGNKDICKRPQMIRLLSDCRCGRVNCIATQTKGYLAANAEDLFFLLYYLFGLKNRIDIVTEDSEYNINTIVDAEQQRENLMKAAEKYVTVESCRYSEWERSVVDALGNMND